MNRWKLIMACGLTSLCVACSSSTLRVQSSPEGADVFAVSKEGTATKIGKTPLDIDSRTQRDLFIESFEIRVAKEGHMPQSALVPPLSRLGGRGSLNFNLAETALPRTCTAQEDAMNTLAQGVAEASATIQKKRFAEAIAMLQTLSTKFNSVAVIYDLQGNAFFLQRDLTRALDSYKRSLALSPGNQQTQRMIDRIQQLQGTGG